VHIVWALINHNPKYQCNFTNILTSFIHSPTIPNCHICQKAWPHHHFLLHDVKSFSSFLTSCTLPWDQMAHITPHPSFVIQTLSAGGVQDVRKDEKDLTIWPFTAAPTSLSTSTPCHFLHPINYRISVIHSILTPANLFPIDLFINPVG